MRKDYYRGKLFISILVLICILGIGYATLGANLQINGTAQIPASSWLVRFKANSINVTTGSVSVDTSNNEQAARIDDDNNVSYKVRLSLPGDFYEFTVIVENKGSIDAMIDSVSSKLGNTEITTGTLPSYLHYSVAYADGTAFASKQLLASNTEEIIKVRIEFKKDINVNQLPGTATTLNLNFQINYVQADNTAVVLPDSYTRLFGNISGNVEQVNISTTDHDNETRFIGANPNNYVVFNNEASCDANMENCTDVKWRIIGVFDGQLKLIRNESILRYLAWDTNVGSNHNYGINQWGPSTFTDNSAYEGADLMRLLNPGYEANSINNSLYWNGTSGNCYNDPNESYQSCDFSGIGLTDTTSRNMIDNREWKIGFIPTSGATLTASYIYNAERGSNTGKVCTTGDWCSDLVNRTATWTGRVGLYYISDYLYATNGGNTTANGTGRSTCLGYDGTNWGSYSVCVTNDWLYEYDKWNTSLSPTADTDLNDLICTDRNGALVISGAAYNDGNLVTKPVVYLKSNVTIIKGNGSLSSPFVLSIS